MCVNVRYMMCAYFLFYYAFSFSLIAHCYLKRVLSAQPICVVEIERRSIEHPGGRQQKIYEIIVSTRSIELMDE